MFDRTLTGLDRKMNKAHIALNVIGIIFLSLGDLFLAQSSCLRFPTAFLWKNIPGSEVRIGGPIPGLMMTVIVTFHARMVFNRVQLPTRLQSLGCSSMV